MGTHAWVNWDAYSKDEPETENFDVELHSDRSFVGGPVAFGPYQLSIVTRESSSVGLAVLLRGAVHADLLPQVVINGELAKSDSAAYHGGTMSDEIAALMSLTLGVRLRVAGTRRLSGTHESGQDAQPMYMEVPRLAHPGPTGRERLPSVMSRPADLRDVSRLATFPLISESDQVELIRAARSYSTALWWANEDANQAWLQLVTAVEIAAKHRQTNDVLATDLIEDVWPEIWEPLLSADLEVREAVARELAPVARVTRAFKDFVEQCAPPAPPQRPQHYESLDWTKMRHHAQVIYEHRSKSLHAGKPFPLPMQGAPFVDSEGAVQEVPGGLNAGGLGGVWDASESPMLLQTFEYIARGALLTWWDELAAKAGLNSSAVDPT
ncbi:hypothetical protein ABIE18_004442 [Arthrobacter sp. 2762]